MFSLGNFDWKNIVGGGSFLKDLGKARVGGLKPLINGLLSHGVGDGVPKDDFLKLSEPLRLLRQSGLDLERSSLREESQQLDFNFSFKDEHIRNLTSGGFLDVRSQTLKMDFSFQSSMKMLDPVTGEEREELFRFELHLEASNVQIQEGRREVRKEDILGFAQKILEKISRMRAEGRQIDGLELNREDLEELGSVEGGKLLKQIGHLIELVRSIDRLSGKRGPHEWLKIDRDQDAMQDARQTQASDLNLWLKVSRVEALASVMEVDVVEAAPSYDFGTGSADVEGSPAP